MKDNPRNLDKSRLIMKRSDYYQQLKIGIYDSKNSDKIAIPCYNGKILKQDVIFYIFLIIFALELFFIFSLSLKSLLLFSLLSAFSIPLYFFNSEVSVESYLTSFFDKNDFLLVEEYCLDVMIVWEEAVIDAEYYGSEKAKEYAIEILNLAKLRKNKAEKDTQDNFKNKWSENADYAKTKHVVERELV